MVLMGLRLMKDHLSSSNAALNLHNLEIKTKYLEPYLLAYTFTFLLRLLQKAYLKSQQ